ncbi:hypothetical protein D9758_017163 [Tetrapyrgos nigripes]|uniref:Uncharacterized protein n=1 Tax=Tetrapyrgos nigripes TaxID=182062 RepID=A0A8H5BTL2_9AGAR|nr:hypothetical protein D9758_017163 [Tetrapyrgos nigripes]
MSLQYTSLTSPDDPTVVKAKTTPQSFKFGSRRISAMSLQMRREPPFNLLVSMLRSRKPTSSIPVHLLSLDSSERRLQAGTGGHAVLGLERVKLIARFLTPVGHDWIYLTMPGLRALKKEGLDLDVDVSTRVKLLARTYETIQSL